jgi:hypothetical protein
MWLPLLLEKLNEREMKSLGMKISAKDIYNINSGSLKDAIVSFGGFCTGEIISNKGLVLTNHHCGFDAVQNHSTLEHNYIRDGFWAMSNAEELPNPGLFVTFIVRIEDVTKQVLNGVTTKMTESERQSQTDKNMESLRNSVKKENYQKILIRGFFENIMMFVLLELRHLLLAILEKILTTGCGPDIQEIFLCSGSMRAKTISQLIILPTTFLMFQKNH